MYNFLAPEEGSREPVRASRVRPRGWYPAATEQRRLPGCRLEIGWRGVGCELLLIGREDPIHG